MAEASGWAVPLVGVGLGLAVAAAAVLSWRMPDEGGALGAEVRFHVAPAGEVSVSPRGPVLTARRLRPGDAAAGRFRVRNLAGRPLRLRLRALPSAPALDRPLRVQIAAGKRRLAGGSLGKLRSFSSGAALRLPREGSRELSLAVRLLPAARHRYEGQIVDVALELEPRRAGAAR